MFTHEVLSTLNELEISIYNYIVKNQEKIATMKIRELADEAHVSTATILRFCKKIGCEGYSDFKLKYTEYLKNEQKYSIYDNETNLKNLTAWVASSEYTECIDHAYEMLKNASRIIFLGVGSSGVLGKYGARYFCNVGRFSLYVDDPFLPILQDCPESTVAIAISESGYTRETIHLTSQMKEHGIRILTITNNGASTLAKISDYNIVYHVPEMTVNSTNITTSLPVIYILEDLAMRFHHDRMEKLKEEERCKPAEEAD